MQLEIEGRQLESIQQELDVTQAKVIDLSADTPFSMWVVLKIHRDHTQMGRHESLCLSCIGYGEGRNPSCIFL